VLIQLHGHTFNLDEGETDFKTNQEEMFHSSVPLLVHQLDDFLTSLLLGNSHAALDHDELVIAATRRWASPPE
jgi:hypothetical protein